MSNDTTRPNQGWKFPNGSYYWHGSVQIDPNSLEGRQIILTLEAQHNRKNPNYPKPSNPAVVASFKFDIHCENGASKISDILSASDFELLKQDTHIMAVINIEELLAAPTDTYASLSKWIIQNSITKVPTL